MPKYANDELLAEYHRKYCRFGQKAHVSRTLLQQFGSKEQLLEWYKAWLERNHPDSEILARLKQSFGVAAPAFARKVKRQATFGDPMSAPGLLHAPTNEMGVIHLFGMVCWQLGFVVESMRAAYPDCEAKRCVDRKRGLWQRVRIEFEFVSSNFRYHRHDPAGCNLIVCWIHDWPACPLEVLELRSVVTCFPEKLALLTQTPGYLLVWNADDPRPSPNAPAGQRE